ncbi:MAG: flagellar basal body P-ring formation chaperone FlgA, partial [Perlucidibaca sp.]
AERWLSSRQPWQGPGLDVRIRAQGLDPRLRLPACRQEIDISLPAGQRIGARTLLQLRCPEPGWKVLMPVTVSARSEVMVAGQTIPAGTVLSSARLERQQRDVASLSQGYLDDAQALDGLRARLTIPAGAVISQPWVEPVPVIRKGQQVMLQSQLGGIVISMAGQALADAAPGERVRVRNSQSGKIIEGLAGADGLIEVQP